MALQMQRAFNYKMLTTMTLYTISAGSFDATNEWVEGSIVAAPFKGVLQAGNKFSQFEEGIALHEEVGGKRYSDFRSLFVTDKVVIALDDKIGIKGAYYNILQQSDEDTYGYNSYLLEKSKDWSPT